MTKDRVPERPPIMRATSHYIVFAIVQVENVQLAARGESSDEKQSVDPCLPSFRVLDTKAPSRDAPNTNQVQVSEKVRRPIRREHT